MRSDPSAKRFKRSLQRESVEEQLGFVPKSLCAYERKPLCGREKSFVRKNLCAKEAQLADPVDIYTTLYAHMLYPSPTPTISDHQPRLQAPPSPTSFDDDASLKSECLGRRLTLPFPSLLLGRLRLVMVERSYDCCVIVELLPLEVLVLSDEWVSSEKTDRSDAFDKVGNV